MSGAISAAARIVFLFSSNAGNNTDTALELTTLWQGVADPPTTRWDKL